MQQRYEMATRALMSHLRQNATAKFGRLKHEPDHGAAVRLAGLEHDLPQLFALRLASLQ